MSREVHFCLYEFHLNRCCFIFLYNLKLLIVDPLEFKNNNRDMSGMIIFTLVSIIEGK